jgi:MFS family permease
MSVTGLREASALRRLLAAGLSSDDARSIQSMFSDDTQGKHEEVEKHVGCQPTSCRFSRLTLKGAGQFLLGLSMGAENANEMGYRQTVTPDRLQGRMNATMRSINRSMIVIGAPLGGFLGDRIGYNNMLWIAALGFLAGATTLGLSRFRGARLDGAYVNPV